MFRLIIIIIIIIIITILSDNVNTKEHLMPNISPSIVLDKCYIINQND
jgi:hypothetical protein